MKINTQMKVREVAGEHIVIMQGDGGVDMTKVVALNESAMYLYNHLTGKEFALQDVVDALLENYEVDPDTARLDAGDWVKEMTQNSLIIS